MATATLAGFDPRYWINCEDPIEMVLLSRIAKKAIEVQAIQREDLANRIIRALSSSIKRGKSGAAAGP
jgi:hypothetical protein